MLKALWRFGKRPHFPNKYFGHYPHFTLNVQRCDNIWPILNPVKVAQGGGANIDPRLQCRLGQAKWIPHNRPQTNVFKARGEKMLPELHFQSLTTQLMPSFLNDINTFHGPGLLPWSNQHPSASGERLSFITGVGNAFTVSIITAAKTVVIIRLDQLDRDGGKLGKQIG